MGYRVIEQENIDIFEDKKPAIEKKRVSLDSIQLTMSEMWHYLIRGGISLFLIWIGVSNAGSYYTPGSRLSGGLAIFFYQWQVGTILTILGMIILYHTFLGSGKKWI